MGNWLLGLTDDFRKGVGRDRSPCMLFPASGGCGILHAVNTLLGLLICFLGWLSLHVPHALDAKVVVIELRLGAYRHERRKRRQNGRTMNSDGQDHAQASAFTACMSLSIFLVLRQPNGKMGRRSPGRGSGGGAGVIDLPSDLLSPRPSLIHSRFCVQNSNRCLSGHASARPARIRKNESEHNRTYD